MTRYVQRRSAVRQRGSDARCALLEGCILRFALKPHRHVLDFIAPLSPILKSCDKLLVGVQVRVGDKFTMSAEEMKRAGSVTSYDERIPPKVFSLFWKAAVAVGARLQQRYPNMQVKYFVSSDSQTCLEDASHISLSLWI